MPENMAKEDCVVKGQEPPPWDLDTALRHIGPMGRWQVCVFLLHGAMYATLAFHFVAFVFLVDTPSHHCKIPAGSTKNDTIPQKLTKDGFVDDMCHMYVNKSINNETVKCTDGWEFDPNSGYISTVATDFELTCGKNILIEISMMISGGTMAVIQVFANRLADSIGRKHVFMYGCTLRAIFGVAKAFSPNMLAYTILDACIQASQTGFASMVILLNIELFPSEHRSVAATSIEFFWLVSLMITALIVYLFRNWRVLQLAMHAPLFLGISYYWLVPESLPWLMSKGRYKQAQKIIERAGRFNKRPIPPSFFTGEMAAEEKALESTVSLSKRDSITQSTTSLAGRQTMFGSGPVWVKRVKSRENIVEKKEETPEEQDNTNATFMDVLKSPKMSIYSLILFSLWFTNSIVYSALNLTVTYLAGDRYLNFFLISLAEVPAVIAFHLALNRFGRRRPICAFHIICGIALLLTLLEVFGVEAGVFVIVMNFVGKFGITASYCSILVVSPELFPTSIRSVFFGICMFFALAANLIAPYCRPLERSIPGIVRGICGGLSILVGVLYLLVPETFQRPLPSSIGEVERWTRTVSQEEKDKYYQLRELSKRKETKGN